MSGGKVKTWNFWLIFISPQYPILVDDGYFIRILSGDLIHLSKQARHDNSVMLLKSRQIQDKDEGGEGKQ